MARKPRKLSYSIGDKFWKMTIVEILDPSPGKRRRVVCDCDCGGRKEVNIGNLKYGSVQSCGCMKINSHGHTPKGVMSPTYASWVSMKGRCHNPKATAYKWYGAAGITVCDRWRFGEGDSCGFTCFLADMGERPNRSLTLDRIDGKLGYQPGNVQWATKRAQGRNRITTKLHPHNGQMLVLREIAELTGQTYERLRHRVSRAGWTIEEAIKADAQPGRRKTGARPRV